MRMITALLALLLLGSGCLEFDHSYTVVAPGIWRAELQLKPLTATNERRDDALSFNTATEGILPFTFEVFSPDSDSAHIIIHNGLEHIRVDDIVFSKNKETARDSMTINFPVYDTALKVEIDGNKMDGYWIVKTKKDYRIPFSARFGRAHRFTTLKKTTAMNISGLWETTFDTGDDAFGAVGSFDQKGNDLTGTFMTETGDFRFLDGTIQGDKLYLSSFDGSHAFLFEGKIDPSDSTIMGSFLSGKHYQTTWKAKKNNQATLADPNELVSLKADSEPVSFSLPTSTGNILSLKTGKPKILQILGTWCPNCRDEGAFLADYMTQHPGLDIDVIGLSFEKYEEKAKALSAISRYKKALKIPYDIVYAGKPKRENILKIFPQLENFVAYPTMIFLDADNHILQIHTGFNGPATPAFAKFKQHFDEDIRKMTEKTDK